MYGYQYHQNDNLLGYAGMLANLANGSTRILFGTLFDLYSFD